MDRYHCRDCGKNEITYNGKDEFICLNCETLYEREEGEDQRGYKIATNNMVKKNGKHDYLIDCLEEKLKLSDFNYNIHRNRKYKDSDRNDIGEIDLMASYNGKYLLLFEMKSNDSIRNRAKAISQLERAKDRYKGCNNRRVFAFYVNPDGLEWIR